MSWRAPEAPSEELVKTAGDTRRCFVISPIGVEDSDIREHADDVYRFIIEPAMLECGIEAARSDHLMEPGRISDQMFDRLFSDDFCIAVLFGQNPNVFYELALAQAAGRPIIALMHRDDELPFDVQDFRCVRYDLRPSPLIDGVYANEVVEHVHSLERAGWRVTPPFEKYGLTGHQTDSLDFLEQVAKYVPPEQWAGMLGDARQSFELMGVSLHSWRRTESMRANIAERSDSGCAIRIMIMDASNPALDHAFPAGVAERTHETVLDAIGKSEYFFSQIANDNASVEFRTVVRGSMHCQITRNDDNALFIPYLNSEPTAYSPAWRCTRESYLYDAIGHEFETLWNGNDPEKLHNE